MEETVVTIEINGIHYLVSMHYPEEGETAFDKVSRLIKEEVKKEVEKVI